MSEVTADKLISAYIKLRNARQKLTQDFESADAELKTKQDKVSEMLLEICKEMGADSIKTQFGTASRRLSIRYKTTDWDSMYKFIKEHDAYHLLEQRIHQTNMKAMLEEHPEMVPMGLSSDSEYVISVRKK
jgi:sugar phosphate isomerase/epimerase